MSHDKTTSQSYSSAIRREEGAGGWGGEGALLLPERQMRIKMRQRETKYSGQSHNNNNNNIFTNPN